VVVVCLQFQLLKRWRQEDQEFRVCLGKVSRTLSQKQNTNNRVRGMVQVLKHLLRAFFVVLGLEPWALEKKKH
jgi:hypothetical protein